MGWGRGTDGRGRSSLAGWNHRAVELLVVLSIVLGVALVGVVPFLIERQREARALAVHAELRRATAALIVDDSTSAAGVPTDGELAEGEAAVELLSTLGYEPGAIIDARSVQVDAPRGCVSLRHRSGQQYWRATTTHPAPIEGRCRRDRQAVD